MTDREALAAALELVRYNVYPSTVQLGVRNTINAAARERLAQMPEKCEHGLDHRHFSATTPTNECPGKLYPPALVERITAVFQEVRTWATFEEEAVAVLEALNE